jgi:hypothetical protein
MLGDWRMNKAILLLPIIACLMTGAAALQQSQGLTQNVLKCKDPTGHKYPCVLVISVSPPPKHTLTCKDTTGHKLKCNFEIVNTKHGKIVIVTIFVSPHVRASIHSITITVQKIVVKVIHEEDERTHKTRTVVIREEDDSDKPTVIIINCFTGCVDQEKQRATLLGTIVSAPVTLTNVNQVTNIVNNVNNVNNVNVAVATNVVVTNTNIINPPPAVITPPKPPVGTPPSTKTQTCPDGSVIARTDTCPTATTSPSTKTQTCPDGSVIASTDTCPSTPSLAPQTQKCPDGSTIDISAICPQPQQQPQNSPPPDQQQQQPPSVDCKANPSDPSCTPPPSIK